MGDIIGEDEDGDGTDFDRIWAMESLLGTYLNPDPECGGYNYPIFGDVTEELENLGQGGCIDRVDIAIEGYVFNESNTGYGNLETYNSQIGGGDDSDHDYNGTDGRLVMKFDPMCIQDIKVQHMMLEFLEVGNNCSAVGDINDDGTFNVMDIVILANCVLAMDCDELAYGCAGDVNGDGSWNVLDIVSLASCILANNCGG